MSISDHAFFPDQPRATAELATKLGLEEKVEKWNDNAARLEENIIKNFYDKENNIFNTVYFNMENATRLDADNSDEFASFVPLWAGVNIGDEAAKKMVADIVIPCKTGYPEQTAIKLEILKKYGFDEAYDDAKTDFLKSCNAPGVFNNSLACALYLKLISEDDI